MGWRGFYLLCQAANLHWRGLKKAASQQCLIAVQGLKGTVRNVSSFRLKHFAATFQIHQTCPNHGGLRIHPC